MFTRRQLAIFGLIFFSLLTAGCSSIAGKRFYQSDNTALEGYDAVAYFTQNKAIKGSSQISTRYSNVTWLFSTTEHRERFLSNPENFLPQYGGYCAYAMNFGLVVSSDPRAFSIVDDKLYLNYSFNVREKWLKAPQAYIASADKHWREKLEP